MAAENVGNKRKSPTLTLNAHFGVLAFSPSPKPLRLPKTETAAKHKTFKVCNYPKCGIWFIAENAEALLEKHIKHFHRDEHLP